MEVKTEKEVDSMDGHPKDGLYDKGLNGFENRDRETRLLEKEEFAIIAIFTAIVIAALLVIYIL